MPVSRQMFAITINTSYGVTEEDTAKLLKFFNKQERAFLITEKTDEKAHYHGGIMFPKEVLGGNLRNQLLRCFPNFDDKQKKHAIKIKNWYNMDWYEEYCKKDSGLNRVPNGFKILMDTFQPQDGEVFPFPDPDDKKDVRPINAWCAKLEKMIEDDERFERDLGPDYTEEMVLRAINTYMYKDRTIDVIFDPRQLQHKVRGLTRYMNKYDGADYQSKNILTRAQENDSCDLCPKCDSMKIEKLSNLYCTQCRSPGTINKS